MSKTVSIYLNGLLMKTYPYKDSAYGEVIRDFNQLVYESREIPEVKIERKYKEGK